LILMFENIVYTNPAHQATNHPQPPTMCRFIKTDGNQCKLSPKKDLCHKHINSAPAPVVEPIAEVLIAKIRSLSFEATVAEPVAEPVVELVAEQKNEEPELIQDEAEIVAEDIASPMSPNTTSAIATPIVEQTKSAPIKKIFDDRECIFNRKGAEAHYWIDKCALGRADVYRSLIQPNGKYWWDTKGYRVINVIHRQGKYQTRRYVYFENMVDMFALIKYFHGKASSMGVGSFECHEVFIGQDPRIKMFFDIESVIPVEAYESMLKWMNGDDSDMAKMVSEDVINAMKLSLEAVDNHFDMYESLIDYAIVSRSRKVADGMKLSYHLITNVSMRVSECKALIKLIKEEYLSCINVKRPDGYKDMLCAPSTLDTNPYSKNGSLSLPGSTKDGHTLTMVQSFKQSSMSLHLIDTHECHDMHAFTEDLPVKANISDREAFEESSSDFIKKALAKLDSERVPAYDPSSMDVYANTPRGNYLRVARTAPSHCPACDRTHDNADTLLLIFNEKQGLALWKCAHNEEMKAKRWFGNSGQKEYELVAHDDDEIEAFARSAKPVHATKASKADKDGEDERMSADEAALRLPAWDIKRSSSSVPPLNDPHNPCCYSDYLTLGRNPITPSAAMKYIYNNFALVNNGGESFFITKNFNKDAEGNKHISYKYIKYGLIKGIPGRLQVLLINPESKKVEIHSFALWRFLKAWEFDITYSEMKFSPFGAKAGYDWSNMDVFNIFTGFVNRFEVEFEVDESRIERYLTHIREAWCNDDIELFDFTVKLFAYMVQFPHLKTAVAMIVMGPEGLGKNFVMELWRDYVIGHNYFLETPSIEAITNKFNAGLEGNLMVVLNEAAKVNKSVDANKAQEVVKDLITEKRRRYERKGLEGYMGECFNNVIMFSNNDYVVRASTEMRRFVFYKGSGRFIGKELEHFAPIKKDFEDNDAGIHLYHYLMNIDLTGFHPQRSAPTTATKEELKKTAIEKPIQWIISCVNEETRHTFISTHTDSAQEEFYASNNLLSMYNLWMESCGERTDTTLKSFVKIMMKYFEPAAARKKIGTIRSRGFDLSISSVKAMISKTARRDDLFDDE
jgi:hypothetical protein